MANRLNLHEELCEILGSRNVYFQPPASIRMKYPAIVYKRTRPNTKHANDKLYLSKQGYQVTVIDEDPDSEIVEKMIEFPMSSFNNHFVVDNLNHDVFSIYY